MTRRPVAASVSLAGSVAASISLAGWGRKKPASETLAATSRPGFTLLEVLAAILITGVGLLALLTLFPLGALEMAQSVKADRCGHAKQNAAATANIWGIRQDANVVNAMLNPGGGLPQLQSSNPTQAASPSYPVFVDPNGWWANNGVNANWRDWMAGQPPGGGGFIVPPRVTFTQLSLTSPDVGFASDTPAGYRQQQLLRWTTFLDDMSFPRDDPSGVPAGRPCIPTTGLVDRAPRYSWAYVCQMPKVGAPAIVQLTVVVYSGRALTASATGETAYSANFSSGGTVVTLNWGATQNPPDVVYGSWIFDATMQPDPRGYFYRVLSATQTSPTTMDVEVQTPIVGAGGAGVVIILDNVIEVFNRGTL